MFRFEKWAGSIKWMVGEALFPLVEDLLRNAYNAGYVEACDIYQNAIDLKGLREQWDKNDTY